VEVRDSGIGIAPSDAERIFDSFKTTKAGGLGMGLAISRSIIEGHGGRLRVAPQDGPGATFQFNLSSGGQECCCMSPERGRPQAKRQILARGG
jgi:signal transduction histidine kinase